MPIPPPLAPAPSEPPRSARSLEQLAHQWLNTLTISRATDLARQGRFDDARSLLGPAAEATGGSVGALHLSARMSAQEGRWLDAEAAWIHVLALDPAHAGAQAGLARLRRGRSGPIVPSAAVAIAGLLGVALLVWNGERTQSEFASLAAAVQRLQLTVEQPVRVAEPPPRPTSAPAPARAPPIQPKGILIDLKAALEASVPGIGIEVEADALSLSFERDLFARGTRLTTRAKESLARVAPQFERFAKSIAIEVRGTTDATPVERVSPSYADNPGLAIARGAAVVRELRAHAALPISVFVVAGSDVTQASPEGRSARITIRFEGAPAAPQK